MAPTSTHDSLGPPLRVSKPLRDISNVNVPNPPSINRFNELTNYFDLIHQDAFYGRAIAFYMDSSAQSFFKMLGSIMVGFGHSYQVSFHVFSSRK